MSCVITVTGHVAQSVGKASTLISPISISLNASLYLVCLCLNLEECQMTIYEGYSSNEGPHCSSSFVYFYVSENLCY